MWSQRRAIETIVGTADSSPGARLLEGRVSDESVSKSDNWDRLSFSEVSDPVTMSGCSFHRRITSEVAPHSLEVTERCFDRESSFHGIPRNSVETPQFQAFSRIESCVTHEGLISSKR